MAANIVLTYYYFGLGIKEHPVRLLQMLCFLIMGYFLYI